MADRGITFSAPMVRALLDGRKTQTRRLITKNAALDALAIFNPAFLMLPGNADLLPHAPGDRLYVREHWKVWQGEDATAPRDMPPGRIPIHYLADLPHQFNDYLGRHRQAMHMPRWASRLTLFVTGVRVQRLQDISEADAAAEGMHIASVYGPGAVDAGKPASWMPYPEWDGVLASNARVAFIHIWDSLHTEPGTRWEDNPWIYAVTFDVRHGNIDKIGGAV